VSPLKGVFTNLSETTVVTVTVNVEVGAYDATAIFTNQNGASYTQQFSAPEGGPASTGNVRPTIFQTSTCISNFEYLLLHEAKLTLL
jgi:hypothetical protein